MIAAGDFEEALQRVLAMLGARNADAAVPESDLVAAEKRLKTPIPAPLRTFYRLCGRHPAMQSPDAFGVRIVDPADLAPKKGATTFIRATNGFEYAIDLAHPEKTVVTHGTSPEKD